MADDDPTTWHVTVNDTDGDTHTFAGIHRVRYEGHWVILERYDGTYGDDSALRAWTFYGPRVKKVSQI